MEADRLFGLGMLMSEYIHALFMYLLSQVFLLIVQYTYSSNETIWIGTYLKEQMDG